MKRFIVATAVSGLSLMLASPVLACAGLIGPPGSVNLLRTTTLAGYTGGVEHYVTSFEFAGTGGAFGSLVPLPDIPTKVERGGDWTLQRLVRETQPQPEFLAARAVGALAEDKAQVILETRIDALDITVLKGGATAVGKWAIDHGFQLPPDAPEVLDFYAKRSPIFMAARFDGDAAAARGVQQGDGTPIHLSIPTDTPWVPLRILGLGATESQVINADVYLLTDSKPDLLHGAGINPQASQQASPELLADLRSDAGMDWIPGAGMWLTHLRVEASASDLNYDLAIGVGGAQASREDAGMGIIANLVAATEQPKTFSLLALSAALAAFAVSSLIASRRRRVAA